MKNGDKVEATPRVFNYYFPGEKIGMGLRDGPDRPVINNTMIPCRLSALVSSSNNVSFDET